MTSGIFDINTIDTTDDIQVLALIDKCIDIGQRSARPFQLIAERNERWCSGDQFVDVNVQSSTLDDAWKDNLPKTTQNHLRNLVNTWTSRLLKDRPSATAFPSSPSSSDIAASQMAAKFIEYFEKEISVDDLMMDTVKTAAKHGAAGFKICFDPTKDSVTWKPITIFDFFLDPKENTEDAKWVVFKDNIDLEDAHVMLSDAGIEDEPGQQSFRINDSEEREGVEIFEIWHKPSPRLPEGLYCKKIGKHLVDLMPYPYLFSPKENKETGTPKAVLPLVIFAVDYHRGSPFGDTWVSDAIGEQRQINETEATLLDLRRKTANVKLIVPSDDIVQGWNSSNQIIVSGQGMDRIGWLPPPAIPQILFADREYHFTKLYQIAGLNEQLSGADSIKSGTSARQIAYLNELDSQKHAGTSRAIEKMLLSAWNLTLSLVQRYYIDQRLMRIVDSSGLGVMAFRGADIAGVDIDLSPRGGLDRYPATKALQAQEDGQAQLIKPEEMLERRATGQQTSSFEHQMRQRMQQQISFVLQGASPMVDREIPIALAMEEILNASRVLAEKNAHPSSRQAIEQLRSLYMEAGADKVAPKPAPKAPADPSAPAAPSPAAPRALGKAPKLPALTVSPRRAA